MPDTRFAEGVIEHEGRLWKPGRGATTTADEFISARASFNEITCDSRWNPSVREDRADEYDQALTVMDQWRRAEPGHRMLTVKQLEARWARQDQDRERAREKVKVERERRKAEYDPARADARLALFEQQSRLQHKTMELAAYEDGTRFPGMDSARRTQKMQSLRDFITATNKNIELLTPAVGDPETVIDENGWLPHERRDYLLFHYRSDRERTVRRLRTEIFDLLATGERKDRIEADLKRHDLNKLIAVPPLTADDMCSDCPTPAAEHGWTTPPYSGPCTAWPGWRTRVEKAWKIIEAGVREKEAAAELPPPAPTPQPLAVIPSGLAITEITQRLQELQEQFPNAEVRRGRANRWELWPGTALE